MIWKGEMCNDDPMIYIYQVAGQDLEVSNLLTSSRHPNQPSTSLLDSVGQDVGVGLEEEATSEGPVRRR